MAKKANILKDGKYEYVPISKLAKLAKVTRGAPRYWIEQGEDNKGRKLRSFELFGRIYISTFHAY